MASITSANAVFILTIPTVYPNGVQLQQFGVDDAFSPEAFDTTETQVGVDGYGVAGYIPNPVEMMVKFLASSPSVVVFENWFEAMVLINDVLPCSGQIAQPSVGRNYTLPFGVLKRVNSMAEARRILQNREFRLTWLPQGAGSPAITASPS
jgi:hypothetical protein